jgi:hypothetical protein
MASSAPTSATDRATVRLTILGLLLCLTVAAALYVADKSVLDIWSAIGTLTSIVGLAIVLVQIGALRRVSEATVTAIHQTQAEIRAAVSLADTTRTIKMIEQVQTYAGDKKYELARLRLQDVRAHLIHLRQTHTALANDDRLQLDSFLEAIGLDLAALYTVSYSPDKVLNPSKMSKSLENAVGLLTRIEAQLKFSGNDSGD